MMEFNAILGHASLEDCQYFFSLSQKTRTCPAQCWMPWLGGSQARFWTVLGNVSGSATKEEGFVVEMVLMFRALALPSSLGFEERLGVNFSVRKLSPCSG